MDKHEIAEKLLVPLFKSITDEYKSQYMRDIWSQFENRVKDSAYTSSLSKFLENIARRMPIRIETRYIEDIGSIINSGQDEEILSILRSETMHVILLSRLIVQEYNKSRKRISHEDIQV